MLFKDHILLRSLLRPAFPKFLYPLDWKLSERNAWDLSFVLAAQDQVEEKNNGQRNPHLKQLLSTTAQPLGCTVTGEHETTRGKSGSTMSQFLLRKTGQLVQRHSSRATCPPLGPPGASLSWSQLRHQFSEKMLLD